MPPKARLSAEFVIPQDEFIGDYFDPKPGQHMTYVGPNGVGKTTTAMKCLARCTALYPETVGVALAMKPHRGPKADGRRSTGDPTVARLTRALGGRTTRTWPPPWWRAFMGEPAFWTLWPKHSEDFRADKLLHYEIFQRALLDSYNKGNRWIFADEVYSLCAELKLDPELIHIWSKGRSMKTAIIGATQRPAFVPKWMYSSAIHLFLWRDNDADARKRYAEISGVDPKKVAALTDGLRKHECLYICPTENIWACLTPGPMIGTDPSRGRTRAPSDAARSTTLPRT